MDDIARQLVEPVCNSQLVILDELHHGGHGLAAIPRQLECSLIRADTHLSASGPRFPIAAVDLTADLGHFWPTPTLFPMPHETHGEMFGAAPQGEFAMRNSLPGSASGSSARGSAPALLPEQRVTRPSKRRKAVHQQPATPLAPAYDGCRIVRRRDRVDSPAIPRPKGTSDNPVRQPSTPEKYISGVWQSLYAGQRTDITEVVEECQAVKSDVEQEVASENGMDVFGRMSILARKIEQTGRKCRSLEIVVQAHWVQCFDDRVNKLATFISRDKAKKKAIAEACFTFEWTEKELRNKMGIWRGYHDIKSAGGWAALVFAGVGLYRFCKYRARSMEETTQTLRALRHRFEVAADTLHPQWRVLLGIIGETTARKYTGHPHDWVVSGPDDEAIPLPQTYPQWNGHFSYTHIGQSLLDEGAWGRYDPRTATADDDSATFECTNCNGRQSGDATLNDCKCYPNLYGTATPGPVPVQIFRTQDGRNNGLVACCPFEDGWAVGEFVGLITSGLEGVEVMAGQTERVAYQIWQGNQGNHTRFVNHSCEPNAQFDRFVWMGKQRIVVASRGIKAGDEITVDYGDVYWQVRAFVANANAM